MDQFVIETPNSVKVAPVGRKRISEDQLSELARVRSCLRSLARVRDDVLTSVPLSGRAYDALLVVRASPPGTVVTVTDLARELGLRQNTVCELIDRLERQGLLVRRMVSENRRKTSLHLTAKGIEAIEHVAPYDVEDLRRAKAALMQVLGL